MADQYPDVEEFLQEHNGRWRELMLEQGRQLALAALKAPMPEIRWTRPEAEG